MNGMSISSPITATTAMMQISIRRAAALVRTFASYWLTQRRDSVIWNIVMITISSVSTTETEAA